MSSNSKITLKAIATVDSPFTRPPIDNVSWLLGQGDISLADWLVGVTCNPGVGVRSPRGPSAPCHTFLLTDDGTDKCNYSKVVIIGVQRYMGGEHTAARNEFSDTLCDFKSSLNQLKLSFEINHAVPSWFNKAICFTFTFKYEST